MDPNAVKYDLPSPTEGAALVDQSAPTANGDTTKVNGQWTADENAQWVSKTGWAPKFGSGDNADTQGPTLLDHQTWVESKLDDKFFGGEHQTIDQWKWNDLFN